MAAQAAVWLERSLDLRCEEVPGRLPGLPGSWLQLGAHSAALRCHPAQLSCLRVLGTAVPQPLARSLPTGQSHPSRLAPFLSAAQVRAGGRKSIPRDNYVIQDRASHIVSTEPYTLAECLRDLVRMAARLLVPGESARGSLQTRASRQRSLDPRPRTQAATHALGALALRPCRWPAGVLCACRPRFLPGGGAAQPSGA